MERIKSGIHNTCNRLEFKNMLREIFYIGLHGRLLCGKQKVDNAWKSNTNVGKM